MNITIEDVCCALDCCDFVSEQPASELGTAPLLGYYMIKPFVGSAKLVIIKPESNGRVYVIFRGSESPGIGTWIVTNFQVAASHFRVLDSTLIHMSSESELKIQGVVAKAVAPGVVHQGILRSWSQLWYGTDILTSMFLEPVPSRLLLLRYLLVAAPAFALASFATSIWIGTLVGIIAILSIMAIESGSLERVLWRRTAPIGSPVFQILDTLAKSSDVWFVGHSLGGAMATLAFSVYRNWCVAGGKKDYARLITFAAPRIGDSAFIQDFESRHYGRYLHVINNSDPVPDTPPSKLRPGMPSMSFLLNVLVLLRAFAWNSFIDLWAKRRAYSPWTDGDGVWRLGNCGDKVRLGQHTRKSYRDCIAQFRKGRISSKE